MKKLRAQWPWDPDAASSDAMRDQAQRLALVISGYAPRNSGHGLVFTSAERGDGTSTVVLGMAREMKSALGLEPLVVEMNRLRPVFRDRLKLDGDGSVFSMYSDGALLTESVRTDRDGLAVLPAGGDWPAAASSKLACRILQDAAPEYDVVFFDTPPALESADALACAWSVKEMILVARAGVTTSGSLAQCKAFAQKGGIRIRGSVLTDSNAGLPGFLNRWLAR